MLAYCYLCLYFLLGFSQNWTPTSSPVRSFGHSEPGSVAYSWVRPPIWLISGRNSDFKGYVPLYQTHSQSQTILHVSKAQIKAENKVILNQINELSPIFQFSIFTASSWGKRLNLSPLLDVRQWRPCNWNQCGWAGHQKENMVYLLGDLEAQGVPLCLLDQSNPLRGEKGNRGRECNIPWHVKCSTLSLSLDRNMSLHPNGKLWGERRSSNLWSTIYSITCRWTWAF